MPDRLKSDAITAGVQRAPNRAMLRAVGFGDGDFGKPMDALPMFIYVNARQPIDALNEQAWGAAFLLLLVVLLINVAIRARTFGRRIG